jgi:hypothetical protein
LLLAAFAGGVLLWRRGHRALLLWLLGTWGLFYAALYGFGPTPAVQARYSLPQALPLLLLAAVALPALYGWSRPLALLAGVYLVCLPVIHLPFERDIGFNDLREHRFAKRAWPAVPPGCTVVEYLGGPKRDHHARFARMGLHLAQGRVRQRFVTVLAGHRSPEADGPPRLSEDLRRLRRHPPACLYYYEGLPCWAEKDPRQPIAPVCALVRQAFTLTPIRRVRFRSRPYDPNLAAGLSPGRRFLTLTLYRAAPRSAPKPDAPPAPRGATAPAPRPDAPPAPRPDAPPAPRPDAPPAPRR